MGWLIVTAGSSEEGERATSRPAKTRAFLGHDRQGVCVIEGQQNGALCFANVVSGQATGYSQIARQLLLRVSSGNHIELHPPSSSRAVDIACAGAPRAVPQIPANYPFPQSSERRDADGYLEAWGVGVRSSRDVYRALALPLEIADQYTPHEWASAA